MKKNPLHYRHPRHSPLHSLVNVSAHHTRVMNLTLTLTRIPIVMTPVTVTVSVRLGQEHRDEYEIVVIDDGIATSKMSGKEGVLEVDDDRSRFT